MSKVSHKACLLAVPRHARRRRATLSWLLCRTGVSCRTTGSLALVWGKILAGPRHNFRLCVYSLFTERAVVRGWEFEAVGSGSPSSLVPQRELSDEGLQPPEESPPSVQPLRDRAAFRLAKDLRLLNDPDNWASLFFHLALRPLRGPCGSPTS